jgi:mycothiol synthase
MNTIWFDLTPDDSPALIALQQAIYAVDGSYAIPLEWDFEKAIADCVASRGTTLDGHLIATGWVRESGGILHLRMLVHPDHRSLRAPLLEWAETIVQKRQISTLRLHDEAANDSAEEFYNEQGYTQIFAENVMRHDRIVAATTQSPEGIALREWSSQTAPQFYAAYVRAFSTRPGFNPPSQEEWIADHDDDLEFRPDLSYVALQNDEPLGFVTSLISTSRNVWGRQDGWINQVGVSPAARGKGLASYLLLRALHGLSEVEHTYLHVNVNNPGAIRVYLRLGFTHVGRRARFEKVLSDE